MLSRPSESPRKKKRAREKVERENVKSIAIISQWETGSTSSQASLEKNITKIKLLGDGRDFL